MLVKLQITRIRLTDCIAASIEPSVTCSIAEVQSVLSKDKHPDSIRLAAAAMLRPWAYLTCDRPDLAGAAFKYGRRANQRGVGCAKWHDQPTLRQLRRAAPHEPGPSEMSVTQRCL